MSVLPSSTFAHRQPHPVLSPFAEAHQEEREREFQTPLSHRDFTSFYTPKTTFCLLATIASIA